MPQVFGLDIASLVADAINAAGGLSPGTLITTTEGARDPDNPNVRAAPTTATSQLECTIETRTRRNRETAVAKTTIIATIIAGTIIPVRTPRVNDQLRVEGTTYTLTRLISEDPAGATLQFEVE